MKRIRALLAASVLLALGVSVNGAPNVKTTHIGYLYPAGGRQGTTVLVELGGQNLRGAKQVFVTGEGVTGKVVGRLLPNRRLKNDYVKVIRQTITRLMRQKASGRTAAGRDRRRGAGTNDRQKDAAEKAEKEEPVELPDHPLLRDLENMSLRELKKVAEFFFDRSLQQQSSPQIAETVQLQITIAADAPAGRRELRLLGPLGLSDPLLFSVGPLPEVSEKEINDFEPEPLPALSPALVLNGQIVRRDIDRFRFRAEKGMKLVIEAEARRLVPYMADAVPEDGEYELEVRDAIDRGREDFVYRITIGEKPFITRMFPLGGRAGAETIASLAGWNLPVSSVPLDTLPGSGRVRSFVRTCETGLTNHLLYAVDDLPEARETEPNNDRGLAALIALPRIINGRIDREGDVDVYRVEGRAGGRIVAEVYARRLGSPVDSMVSLSDADGRVLARNDDRETRRTGLFTHLSDSYLSAELPTDGVYFVRVEDTQRHGGEEYAYRLRISAPRPDFTVMTTPSALNVPAGSTVPFTAHVFRHDGFEGEIRLELSGAPGFMLSGARIPAGKDRVRLTLTAPPRKERKPIPLTLIARAEAGRRTIERTVLPAEDVMQAFLWRHLVPTEEFLVAITNSAARIPPMRYAGDGPVMLPAGGTARVRMRAPRLPNLTNIRFELGEPPAGVSLRDIGSDEKGLLLVLEAGPGAEIGSADNLIVEVYAMVDASRGRRGKDAAPKGPVKLTKIYIGVLPAIPMRIVR